MGRVEGAGAHDDLLLRGDLVDDAGGVVHERDPRGLGFRSRGVEVDLPHGGEVQHVEVLAANGLLQVRVVARAAVELAVQVSRPLLHAGAVPRVVVLHNRNLQRLRRGLDEAHARRRDVPLEAELQRPIRVRGGVPGLVAGIEPLGGVVVGRVEGGAADEERVDVGPAPAGVADADPVVVDGGAAAAVVETVGDGGAAEAAAAVVAQDAAVEVFLGRGVEGPVDGGAAEELVAAGGLVGGDDVRVRPRFEDEDPTFAGFAQPVGEHEAGGAAWGWVVQVSLSTFIWFDCDMLLYAVFFGFLGIS